MDVEIFNGLCAETTTAAEASMPVNCEAVPATSVVLPAIVKDNQTSFIETNGQFAHIIQEFNRYSVDDVAVKTEVPRGTIRIPAKLDLTQVPAADAPEELVGYFPSTCRNLLVPQQMRFTTAHIILLSLA